MALSEAAIDAQVVANWLAGALDARTVTVEQAAVMGGGAIQENWALDLVVDGQPLAAVLRTDSPSRVAVSLGRVQEHAVLRAAFAAGVACPEPLAVEPSGAVLGRPFYVMRRLPGEARGHVLVRDPRLEGEAGDSLAECLGRELATLHRVTPPSSGLDFLSVPEMPVATARVAEYRRYLDALEAAEPTIEWALRWLERHAPPVRPPVLVHGDCRTGNYLVDDGRLTGILDWEFAAWSDRHEDLGWFLVRYWRFGRDTREAGGIGSRAALLRGYRAVAGDVIEGDELPYWEVMGTVRWAVIALQQAARFHEGGERRLELGLTGHVVPELEGDLLDMIESCEATWRTS